MLLRPYGSSRARRDRCRYRGRFLLVYFGFTHCRVVCPRSLARLSEALSLLDKLADRIQPLYVTVDPARDTPVVMKAYLETVSALHRPDRDARASGRREIHLSRLCPARG